MRRMYASTALAGLAVLALATVGLPALTASGAPATVRAGVGVVDATFHVGVSAGQYASARYGFEEGNPRPEEFLTGEFDPNLQQTKRSPSYGVQSRLSIRAIVVEGTDGTRIALVKNDNYLAQDMLLRRTGQLLASGNSGVTTDRILMAAAHNHSAPYYATPSAGVWIFQDVMDVRMFEYQARATAQAIEEAAANLRPARMGATTVRLSTVKANIVGPAIADDGTPAGYPRDFGDTGLVVVRFDDITNPHKPRPLATWMNFGEHPESLDGYDLISGDYLSPLQRMVERETGAPLVFSQGDVGSAEGPYDRDDREMLPDGTYRVWAHSGYAQAERAARLMADAVLSGWRDIGQGSAQVGLSSNFPVMAMDRWVPGPVSHPYPGVSNCRTETSVEGNPGMVVLGLPDCARGMETDPTSQYWETLKETGLPLPENYDAPAPLVVPENARIHLQAFRLGEVLLASPAGEAQVDLVLNFESRADAVSGNIWDGFDWAANKTPSGRDWCVKNQDTTWSCANPGKPTEDVAPVSDERYRRMRAQIHNDAKGWDDPAYAPYANSEPADPSQIKGNFTKEELPASLGYKLPVLVGHAGDYNGYIVSYREFMSRDSYRKALTTYGPHTADYMATRLVRMAGALKGGPEPGSEPLDALAQADEVRQTAEAEVLGQVSAAAYDGWEATLADDAGEPEPLAQPADIRRFDAASFTWRGGNNWTDNPLVRVERMESNCHKPSGPCTDKGRWAVYADQTGEVQTALALPTGATSLLTTRAAQQEWRWTATFEAFDFFPRTIDPRGPQIPSGTYRFVVDGQSRASGATVPYHLVSQPFTVTAWEGIQVSDPRAEPDGSASFAVAPIRYPLTYSSPIRFVSDDGRRPVCHTCTFRPWAQTGTVASAALTVVRANGRTDHVAASLRDDGRWYANAHLRPGDRMLVERGGIIDGYGEINGAPSTVVQIPGASLAQGGSAAGNPGAGSHSPFILSGAASHAAGAVPAAGSVGALAFGLVLLGRFRRSRRDGRSGSAVG